MPEPLDALLLDLGLDLGPVKDAARVITATMSDLNRLTSATEKQAVSAAQALVTPLNDVRKASEAAIKAALAAILQQKELEAAAKKQTAELKIQEQTTANQIKLSQSHVAVEREKKSTYESQTAELRKQTAEIAKQRAEIALELAEERKRKQLEGGEKGGFLSKISGALFGGGVAGAVGGAVLTGAGIGAIVEAGTEGIIKFVEKLKEASTEAGKLSHVWDLFQKASAGQGTDADTMLARLRDSTGGLVDKLTLATYGSRVLQSGIKSLTPEKIQELTKASVELAEANGKSAKEAIDQLTNAFTRGGQRAAIMLSRVTGIPPAALRIANISPGVNRAQRDVESLEHAMSVVIAQAEKLGQTPQTLEQAIARIKVHITDLYQSFGKGFNESVGAQTFIGMLKNIGADITSLEKSAEKWGQRLGTGMAIALPVLITLKDLFTEIAGVVSSLIVDIGRMFGAFSAGDGVANIIGSIGHGIMALNVIIGANLVLLRSVLDYYGPIFTSTAKSMGMGANDPKDMLKGFLEGVVAVNKLRTQKGGFSGYLAEQQDAFTQKMGKEMFNFDDALAEAQKKRKPGKYTPAGIDQGETNAIKSQRISAEEKAQEALAASRQHAAQLALEEKKSAIEADRELENNAYRDGQVSLEKHLETLEDLELRSYNARGEEYRVEYLSKLEKLKAERKKTVDEDTLKKTPADIAALHLVPTDQQVKDAAADYGKKTVGNQETLTKALNGIQSQGDKDRIAALKTRIEGEARLQEEANKHLQQMNEKALQGGELSPDAFFAAQEQLINADRDVKVAAAETVYQSVKSLSAAAQADLNNTVAKATQAAKEQIETLRDTESQRRLAYTQHKYGPQTQTLERQLQFQQSTPEVGAATANVVLVQQLIEKLKAEREELMSQLPTAKGDDLFRLLEVMQQLYQQQQKYNLELQKMRDLLIPIGSAFGGVGGGIETIFHSKFAQNLGQQIGAGARGLSQSQELLNTFLIPTQRSGVDRSGAAVPTVGDHVKKWTDSLSASISVITNFTSSILGAKSAISGAAGGTIGGLGLGKDVGGLLKSVTGIAAFGGPLGEIAGGVAGGVIGAITGHKQATVTKNINDLNTTFRNINNAFSQNTNNLQLAIGQLNQLLNTARMMQASSKKGSAQYQSVIDQYTQQIVQLQTQQQQVLRTMNQQLAILAAPVGEAQSYLGTLQGILQQYQQFEGAAQSANDLAKANQFLTESLQQYDQTLSTQLLQDNQQAIQDALQLNDLLVQRSTMMLQYQQQVQSVLSQGVLTRQMTRAQTAGQQIELLNLTHTRQLEQLNEQISAAQYKVQLESQVFTLAQTRVGLENQLLIAQNAQTKLQMVQIYALSDLIAQITSGDWSNGPLGALLSALQTVTNPSAGVSGGNIGDVLRQLLGGGVTPGGTDVFENLAAQSYQSRAQLGFGGYRGQSLNA